jgi:pimeloyl-ACP methyl ester carboxylesterase
MPDTDYLHTLEALLLHQAPHEWLERADDATLAAVLRRAPREVRDILQKAIGADRALQFIGNLERRVDLALDQFDETTAPAADPDKPVVILLPGFMGVHLADAVVGRVWLDPAAALRGDLSARAALDANGTADALPGERLLPDGLVRVIYADLTQALRAAGHAVLQFPFDFRRSLVDSTGLLRDLLADLFTRQPTSRIVLLGHSMGALLAAMLPEIMPDVVARIEQTIFLGGPLRGTFDSVESVIGTHWILPRLVSLSPRETSLDFQASLATWPGVFGMLPDPVAFPDCACASAFDATVWPPEVVVRQAMLDEARRVKASVRESAIFRQPKPVIQLLATRYPTVGSLVETPSGALAAGPRTCQGDGVVAASAALVPGVIGYRTTFPHTLAPVERSAIQAVLDLIRTGLCDLPPIDGSDVSGPITPGSSPEIDMAQGLFASGAEAMRNGLLDFDAVAWLLSPGGLPGESID